MDATDVQRKDADQQRRGHELAAAHGRDRTRRDRRARISRLAGLAALGGLLAGLLVVCVVLRLTQPESVQANEIDLAGLQRRLSERVAFDTARIVSDPDDTAVRVELADTALRLRRIRTGLLDGDAPLGLDGIVPEQFEALYGRSGLDLSDRLQAYEDAALAVATADGAPPGSAVAVVMDEADGEHLVLDLDRAVETLADGKDDAEAQVRRQVLAMLLGLVGVAIATLTLVVVGDRRTRRALRHSRRLSEQLAESEDLYRRTVDCLLDGVVVVDEQERVVSTNAIAGRVMRRARSAGVDPSVGGGRLIPMLDADGGVLPPAERPGPRAIRTQETVVGQVISSELADGRHWFRCNATPLTGSSGRERQAVLTFTDITSERRMASELAHQEHQFRIAFQHAPIAKAIVAADGTLTEVNQAFADLVGHSVEEMRNRTFQDITHPDDVDADVANVQRLLDGAADTYRMEKRYIARTGEVVYVELAVAIVRPVDQEPYFVAQVVDLGDRKRAELTQAAALEHERRLVAELRVLDEAKSQLVSTVSHELRTPLTSTIGYLELLLDGEGGETSPVQRQMLEVAMANSDRLLRLIEDLLLVSKIEEGQLRRGHRPVAIDDVVGTATRRIAPMALRGRVELEVRSGSIGSRVYGDAKQLERILVNIANNAVKFTPAGGRVIVETRADPGRHTVDVVVTDTGVGIADHEQARIFEPFYRTANSYVDETQGSGLGLAIAADLVRLHQGAITVESNEGAGTTITVTLPTLGHESMSANAPAELPPPRPSTRRTIPVRSEAVVERCDGCDVAGDSSDRRGPNVVGRCTCPPDDRSACDDARLADA